MIVGIGIDIIEIERIENAILKNKLFLEKVFTEKERQYFQSRNNRSEVVAGNFAAKEAIVKALGVGFVEIGLKDVEVLRDVFGKPVAIVHSNAKNILGQNCTVHVSISHCRQYATANAIIECLDGINLSDNEVLMYQKNNNKE